MTFPLVGMDVGFYSKGGAYPLRARCEILAELGYTATNLTLWSEPAWADLPDLPRAAAENGLDVSSLYVTVDLAGGLAHPELVRALDLIGSTDASQRVELALLHSGVASSDPAGDDDANRFLDAALARASQNDVQLLLYPHAFAWMERAADALRLAEHYADRRLGIAFAAFHWYAIDGTDLRETLERLRPHLGMVNTNGSRQQSGSYFPATIEPIGDGEFDNFHFLGLLRELGYDGYLGVQSYGIGGDAYTSFRRSIENVRSIEDRLARAPHWAALRTDHI
jgi:sugar phosphate isomerase/epimerase